jgi:hypothetical protein
VHPTPARSSDHMTNVASTCFVRTRARWSIFRQQILQCNAIILVLQYHHIKLNLKYLTHGLGVSCVQYNEQ